jgi:hypothetical protein
MPCDDDIDKKDEIIYCPVELTVSLSLSLSPFRDPVLYRIV